MNQWIRKWIAAACIAAFSTLAAADTVAGLYAGAGIWSAGPGGNIGGTTVDVDALGLSSETNAFVYVALEHPVPALPNVKLQHTRLSSRGEALLSRRFRLDDVEFLAGETVSTELDLTHTDAVMYYELLDNVVSLDLGGTLRVFNGHARAASRSQTLSESVDIDLAIPIRPHGVRPGTNRATGGLCNQRDGERHWLQREFAPGSFRTNRLCIPTPSWTSESSWGTAVLP